MKLLFIALLIVSLAGCGSSSKKTTPDGSVSDAKPVAAEVSPDVASVEASLEVAPADVSVEAAPVSVDVALDVASEVAPVDTSVDEAPAAPDAPVGD